jgi:outer membrane protein assembly factor BamA
MTARSLALRALRLLCAVAVVVLAPASAAARPGGVPEADETTALGAASPELGPGVDLGALAGKPITRIEVTTEDDRWPASPRIASVRVGEAVSAEAARRAMRELLETGAFARARAEAIPEGDGALLRIRALPRRVAVAVRVSGAVLDLADTLDAAGLGEGAEVTAPSLRRAEAAIRERYARRGFTGAAVKVDAADTDDPLRVIVSVTIEPKAPRTITERVFVVAPAVSREVGALETQYRMGKGDRVDETALSDADRELTELLREHAFYRAEVRHALRHEGPWSYLYVYLDAGPRILPAFDGNRAFDEGDLERALALDKAGAGNPGELVDRLRDFYRARGFLDVEIAAAERGQPGEPVHFLTFTIRENDRVRVVKRLFSCLPKELGPSEVGKEIDAVLEEELPGSDLFSAVDPRVVDRIFGSSGGARAVPMTLEPTATYEPQAYDKALKQLRDVVHGRGYLNALVGPVSVLRASCSKRSPAGRCEPEPIARPVARCASDAVGLPLPEPEVPEAATCKPDPRRGVECAPEVTLWIPLHLGPKTTLYDLAFEGNRSLTEQKLAGLTKLELGLPFSNVEVEAARLRVLDEYRNRGFAYADVRAVIEPSPDRTRARARFVITERDLVTVTDIVVKGAIRTDEALIRRRMALRPGSPYRQDLARLSEERIATLGTFSSVSIALESPEVPQKQKRVVVTVVENLPQYLDPRIGFSTGEGIRFAFEYGHRNVAGEAIVLTLRVQLSYLFDFMILDPQVRVNYHGLPLSERLARRNTATLTFPEIGLGPLISLSLDGIDVRDNQRDFGLTKQAFVPSVNYKPRRGITATLGGSVELNDVSIFNAPTVEQAILDNPALTTLLRVPDGRTFAVAQRLNVVWDRRDNPFAATKGTLIAAGVEHVNAFPSAVGGNTATITSHFLRFTTRLGGYVRLTSKGTALALSLSAGYNLHLAADSKTYPDRLFFLGGVDTIRAFLLDAVVPEDIATRILNPDPKKPLTIDQVAIRGGDVSINPRAELRVPLNDTVQIGLFLDTGNLWVDPKAINVLRLRYAAGAGLRLATPVGPIALDYGINLDRRPWEDFGAFHFSIGLF